VVLRPPADAKRRTAHETVAATLRRAILSGELPGGTRLVQADLADQLGMSNTPVREAMRELATEGLIRLDSYRGAVVHQPTPAEIIESYELTSLLEPTAVRRAAERITPEELERLRSLVAAMRTIDDVGEYVEVNRQFHTSMHQASGSPRLASILESLHNTGTLHTAGIIKRGLRSMRDSDAEHERILSALERRDGEEAAALIDAHLQKTLDAVKTTLSDGHAEPA
jgi:DNA-binding GntR family transcriptional regulator